LNPASTLTPIGTLNQLDRAAFRALLGGVFEHSPWVAERAWAERPFADIDALHAVMVRIVREAGAERQLELLCAHPELAYQGSLTTESKAEQRGMGLDTLGAEEADDLADKNRRYRDRFGIPFIIAVRGQRDRGAILAALTRRLAGDIEAERQIALGEVATIAQFRLHDLISDDPPGETTAAATGRLTVHALDTATGLPASGLPFSLGRLDNERTIPLGRWITNADGRCDQPLLAGDALTPGTYEILFEVGAWRSGPGFYDAIPIRFRVTDASAHYHIPLLLAPFGYSTYRGS
jgi:2-oxo-4-hydroxy-4-carboxy-5-ureidoimidazoline decarboxylase